jgi:hypothetical protein
LERLLDEGEKGNRETGSEDDDDDDEGGVGVDVDDRAVVMVDGGGIDEDRIEV